MTITAWYMDDIESDQRLPHQKTIIPDLDIIAKLGVLHWSGITGGVQLKYILILF